MFVNQLTIFPSFLQAGCPSCRPTNSVKALKADNRKIFCGRRTERSITSELVGGGQSGDGGSGGGDGASLLGEAQHAVQHVAREELV